MKMTTRTSSGSWETFSSHQGLAVGGEELVAGISGMYHSTWSSGKASSPLLPSASTASALTAFPTRAGLTLNEHLSGGVLQVQILVEI